MTLEMKDKVDSGTRQETVRRHLQTSADVKTRTADLCASDIVRAAELIADCIAGGGKILLCGNGGSAADCQHMAAEFVSRLTMDFARPGIPAIALTTDTSLKSRSSPKPPSALSNTSSTSQWSAAGRSDEPANRTSSAFSARSSDGVSDPAAHTIASATLDFPDPFGPTTTATPGSRRTSTGSGNDLKPRSLRERRCTAAER